MQLLVSRNKHIELFLSGSKQVAIRQSGPSQLESRHNGVIQQVSSKWYGRTLVKEDPHGDKNAYLGHGQALLGKFQNGKHLPACYAGKPTEKIVDCSARFEILENCLYRHSGTFEQPRAANLCWVPFNRIAFVPVQHTERIQVIDGKNNRLPGPVFSPTILDHSHKSASPLLIQFW